MNSSISALLLLLSGSMLSDIKRSSKLVTSFDFDSSSKSTKFNSGTDSFNFLFKSSFTGCSSSTSTSSIGTSFGSVVFWSFDCVVNVTIVYGSGSSLVVDTLVDVTSDGAGDVDDDGSVGGLAAVSYTHLTLPTKRIV